MKPVSDAVFRVDANSDIGLGHLRRCLVLARELRARGLIPRWVVGKRLDDSVVDLLEGMRVDCIGDSHGQSSSAKNEDADAKALLEVVGSPKTPVGWVVVDNYSLNAPWERMVGGRGFRVLAIDDLRHRPHHAAILLSDSSAPFAAGLDSFPGGAAQLLGPPYALIDPQFAFNPDSPIPADSSPKRLLATYGGADPTNESLKLIEALEIVFDSRESEGMISCVDLVVGQANPRLEDLRTAAAKFPKLRVVPPVPSLAPLTHAADLILTAAGNSLVESLAARKPCLPTITAENQKIIVAELVERGLVKPLGWHAETAAGDIATAIRNALQNYRNLAEVVRNNPLFDHLGAARVAQSMRMASQ